MESSEMFLLFGAVALIVIGIVVLAIRAEKKRTEHWRAVAERNGYEFRPRDDSETSGLPFGLFNKGHSRQNRNVMSWYSGSTRVALSDYRYTISTGKSSTTVRRAVVLIREESLDLPRFSLRREHGVLDWIGEKFGVQDIDFPEDEQFSKSFVLKGDQDILRSRFGPDLRAYLVQHIKGFGVLEGSGSVLMIERGKSLKPDQHHEFVQLATDVHAMLSRSW